MSRRDSLDLLLFARDAKLQVAHAVLALRRGDHRHAEPHLVAAQRALHQIERELAVRDAPR
jgi:hypothetical protein